MMNEDLLEEFPADTTSKFPGCVILASETYDKMIEEIDRLRKPKEKK